MNAIAEIHKLPEPPSTVLTPMAMIDRALSSGASPDTLERLMALQERWEAGQAKKAHNEAMVEAQLEMRPVSADASNPQTKSRYASYHALDGAIRPIYSHQGFSISFDTAEGAPEGCIRVVCFLSHRGGHTQSFHIDMPADGKGAKGGDVMTKTHATGAAVTYGRRYLLGMVFNIAVGEDRDGNASDPSLAMEINAEQFQELTALLEETNSQEADMLKYVKAETMESMTLGQYAKAKAALVQKVNIIKQKAAANAK